MEQVSMDRQTARERLKTLGWIPSRSEYFRHVQPPAEAVWLGEGVSAAATGGKTDGWEVQALDAGQQPAVEMQWLDVADATERTALFAGAYAPQASDADRLALAHRVVCQRGLRLHVAAGGTARLALHRTAQSTREAPALVVDLAPGAQCILLETHERADAAEAVVQNLQINVRLGAGARLQHVRVVQPQADDQLAHVVYASVGEGASYEQALIGSGAKYHLQRTEFDLSAPRSNARIGSALFAAGNVLDQQVEAFHRSVKTRSEVETLMLASGRARGVVNAMCRMAHGADEAWTRQRLSGIPTAGQPKIVLRPHLVICHDNVEAVHGATWGALPEDAMFYARQRGLDEKVARALIVKGMMIALLNHGVDDPDLLDSLGVPERLDAAVAAYLGLQQVKGV